VRHVTKTRNAGKSLSSICPEPGGTTGRTRIIAHRGASGYLPEHTAEAKALAYGLGVDFIEQDIVATKDHELVVLHDITLDDVSDVRMHFPDRRRDDGHYYVIDFTLAELDEISLLERRATGSDERQFPGRFPYDLPVFKISCFEDEVRLLSGLNASTGRHVGIYPEIKDPGWHAAAGVDLTALVHDTLEANRELISGPVFIQSFDANALHRLRQEFTTSLPLVQLLGREEAEALGQEPNRISAIAAYASGVGLPFATLMEPEMVNGRLGATRLARLLIDSELVIHPYTMRRDVAIPAQASYVETLRFLIHELEVDALFCDHPDDALAIRDGKAV